MIKKTNFLTEDERKIRKEVFMLEQGFEKEFDEIDEYAVHLVYFEDNTPIAVCRYYPGEEWGTFHLGRLAIRKEWRGKNIGTKLVRAAEEEIRKDGGEIIKLSAQVQARGFYEKCGYIAIGETYLDEGCPHITMVHHF